MQRKPSDRPSCKEGTGEKKQNQLSCLEEVLTKCGTLKGHFLTCWVTKRLCSDLQISSFVRYRHHPCCGRLWGCICLWVISASVRNPHSYSCNSPQENSVYQTALWWYLYFWCCLLCVLYQPLVDMYTMSHQNKIVA